MFTLPAVGMIPADLPTRRALYTITALIQQTIQGYIPDNSTLNRMILARGLGRAPCFSRHTARDDARHGLSAMSVTIKTADEIAKMRIAGRLASEVLDMITPHVRAGITTDELDRLCHDHIVNTQQAIPAPLNYRGFPKSICTSVNHQVCHGIPGNKTLKNGDIVNIDITVIKDEFHGDTSRMFMIGEPSVQARRLINITYECMVRGIRAVRPGARLGDIGFAVQSHAEANGFSIVREYCGHGIGRVFHEEPQVLHYGSPATGMTLEPGMTFTVEPMVNAGKRQVRLLPDGWTVVTKDHSLSAQWEHTVLVTPDGYDVLTLRPDERI
jgi:methionyl aminopeptidase